LFLFRIAAKGLINIQNTDTMHKSKLYKTKTTKLKQKSKFTVNVPLFCAVLQMSDQEVENISEADCEPSLAVQNKQQSVTVTDTSLPDMNLNTDSAVNAGTTVATNLSDSSVTADSKSIPESVLLAAPEQAVQILGMPDSSPASHVLGSTVSTCQTLRILPAVSNTGQISGVPLAAKTPGFVLCQITSGGQTVLVPRSSVTGIQMSSGTTTCTSSLMQVPVFKSAVQLKTVSSAVSVAATASSTAAAVVVTQASSGIRLLQQVGTNNAAPRANVGVMLNQSITPQRLALAIAPANATIRPSGIRLLTIRNGTPVAIGGVPTTGGAIAPSQLKLVTPPVPLSGVRPVTSVTAGLTTVASSVPVSASTVSVVRQRTAVNDVQAYLRRIEELKSSQSDQGARAQVTSAAATVRAPLRAKAVLPTPTSTQQIVLLQSGSQPQLANISASQLVGLYFIACATTHCYAMHI